MQALTPDERRGALLVVALLLIGAAYDAWRAFTPLAPAAHPVVDARVRFRDASDSARVAPVPPAAVPGDSVSAGRLDLNRASEAQLDALPGIGPVLARRIVEHRRLHGPFRQLDELRAVRGVGPRLLERLRPRVSTSP